MSKGNSNKCTIRVYYREAVPKKRPNLIAHLFNQGVFEVVVSDWSEECIAERNRAPLFTFSFKGEMNTQRFVNFVQSMTPGSKRSEQYLLQVIRSGDMSAQGIEIHQDSALNNSSYNERYLRATLDNLLCRLIQNMVNYCFSQLPTTDKVRKPSIGVKYFNHKTDVVEKDHAYFGSQYVHVVFHPIDASFVRNSFETIMSWKDNHVAIG